jgi:uncharacterized protein YndB with AHSA1/START domain
MERSTDARRCVVATRRMPAPREIVYEAWSSEDIFIADWGDYDLSTIPVTVTIGCMPSEKVKN